MKRIITTFLLAFSTLLLDQRALAQNAANDAVETITEFRYSVNATGGGHSVTIKNDSIFLKKNGPGGTNEKKKKYRLSEPDWENLLICVSDYELPEYAKPRGNPVNNDHSEEGITIVTNKSSYYCDLRGNGLPDLTVPDLKIAELLHIFQGIECTHYINCQKKDTSFTILSTPEPGDIYSQYNFTGKSTVFQCIEDKPNYDLNEAIKKMVLFEIDSSKNIFSLKDSSLIQAKAKLFINCHCSSSGVFPISNGKISGIRQSRDEWEVNIHVFYSDETGSVNSFQEVGIYRYKW